MSEISDIFLLIGALFSFLGALGLMRMPDVYTRLQAGTKAVTLGALSILLGIAWQHPSWWGNILIIAVLVMLTNPISSAMIARAALFAGIKPWSTKTMDKR